MNRDELFKAIFRENKDRVYRICCCYMRDPDIRNDVYQEALVNIWKGIDTFKYKSNISTWIFRVTVNTCLGYIKKEKRTEQQYERITDQSENYLAGKSKHENTDELEDNINVLYKCINKLSAIDKTFISLYLENLDTSEIAEVLGISEVNARVKLSRIKKHLKEIWEKNGNEF